MSTDADAMAAAIAADIRSKMPTVNELIRSGADDVEGLGREISIPMVHMHILLSHLDVMALRGKPMKMDVAPETDGWIYGFVGSDERMVNLTLPWIALTRCDGGWCDEGGYGWTPDCWLPLPDPQPMRTGWRKAEGHIVIERPTGPTTIGGKPTDLQVKFVIYVRQPDGDAREGSCDFAQTLSEARERAGVMSNLLDLPVIEDIGLALASSGVPVTRRVQ